MPTQIDWEALAERRGTVRENGEFVSGDDALWALEVLLGEENLKRAVEHYIAGGPGSELARVVLRTLHPWSAMKHCYDIYKSEATLEERRMAVELLRVVADRRAWPWIEEFLSDPDPTIQAWGIGVLYELIYSDYVNTENAEEAAGLISRAAAHENPDVRRIIGYIRDCVKEKNSHKTY